MEHLLTDFDVELSKLLDEQKDKIDNLTFVEFQDFTLTNNLEINLDVLNFAGIYFFEIKLPNGITNWKEWIQELWEVSEYKRRFTPNIKIKRIGIHNTIDGWIPLYIGKSRCIKERIGKHIFLEIEKTTFALKLKERKNLHGLTFRISTMKVDVKNYDIIVPLVENRFRNIKNPILGKQ